MIISKAPLRMSFAGGGSDMREYYRNEPGAVVSSAIDKYIYITINNNFDHMIRLKYSQTEEVESPYDIKHDLIRESLLMMGIEKNIEITSIADIPDRGSGLGSSSAFTVALLHAISAYKSVYVSADSLAKQSCHIEIEKCKQMIGKQDQYASAYGGFNFITFNKDDSVFVEPIIIRESTKAELKSRLLLFYTRQSRRSSDILSEQSENLKGKDRLVIMKKMVDLAYKLKEDLENNNINDFGGVMHENWKLKREMASGVSNNKIDEWYNAAIQAGAEVEEGLCCFMPRKNTTIT